MRDLECASPFCETPASRCEIDHIIPYSKGGLTTQENGRLLCGPCNKMRNVAEPPWGLEPPGGWAQTAAEHWPDPMVVPEPPGGSPEPSGAGPQSKSAGPEPPGG